MTQNVDPLTEQGSIDPRDHGVAETDSSTNRLPAHRWTCPFCDRSRLVSADSEEVDESAVVNRAVAAVRGHIYASDGDGHGPRNVYPENFDPSSLDDFVETVE